MPRPTLIRSSEFPYHVTNRANNKEWFYIPIEEVWNITTKILGACTERYRVVPYAFVLMSNHYHLIISAPDNNLDAMMRFFQTEVARAIQRRADRINHIFGNRYKWSLLWNPEAVAYAYKYVLRNPVRAGLALTVERYPFSSINPDTIYRAPWTNGLFQTWTFVPNDFKERLVWLNRPTNKEREALIANGLRRAKFKFPQGHDHLRKLMYLENDYGIPIAPATFPAGK